MEYKTKQKYALFSESLIGAHEVDKILHIFLTRANQRIQEISRHFDGTLNHYGTIFFAEIIGS